MTKRSPSSLMIDRVLSCQPNALLRAAGFRKGGRSSWRERGGILHIVNIQASWLNTPDKADFTINIQVTFTGYHEMAYGQSAPKNPAATLPMWDRRIADLMSERCDRWWRVTGETEPSIPGAEVAEAIERFGLPYLDQYDGFEAIVARLDRDLEADPPPWEPVRDCAILAWHLNDRSRAMELIELCETLVPLATARLMIMPLRERMRLAMEQSVTSGE